MVITFYPVLSHFTYIQWPLDIALCWPLTCSSVPSTFMTLLLKNERTSLWTTWPIDFTIWIDVFLLLISLDFSFCVCVLVNVNLSQISVLTPPFFLPLMTHWLYFTYDIQCVTLCIQMLFRKFFLSLKLFSPFYTFHLSFLVSYKLNQRQWMTLNGIDIGWWIYLFFFFFFTLEMLVHFSMLKEKCIAFTLCSLLLLLFFCWPGFIL